MLIKSIPLETVSAFTEDGGKTWKSLAIMTGMWMTMLSGSIHQIHRHFMIGGDGGVYETFDKGATYFIKPTCL